MLKSQPTSKSSRPQLRLANFGVGGFGVSLTDSKNLGSRLKTVDPSILNAEVASAKEVLRVELELLALTESKKVFLEESKKCIGEKLIAFKFGMDDRNVDLKEGIKNVKAVEEDLETINLRIWKLMLPEEGFSTPTVMHVGQRFRFMLDC